MTPRSIPALTHLQLPGGRHFDFLAEAPCERLRTHGLAFTPDAGAIWLLRGLDPFAGDRTWGRCNAGLRCPELGWVRLTEVTRVRGWMGRAIRAGCAFRAGAAAE
ncbi:MAG: DUF2958 domain-containing protein [Pseudomonas sp.]|uniref:DUF2958 domain-containing protein n=1 Tax=Pseudomonas sp. TaxID=306 RepID=UPI001224457D|nr:MAG: DUF2958 domain-containing protein [Pseudomonas sp.]